MCGIRKATVVSGSSPALEELPQLEKPEKASWRKGNPKRILRDE